MIKKLFLLFLAVALSIYIFPANAFASSVVDLSRIKFSSGKEDLTFKFGNLSMDGKLSQVYPFTEEEIDKIVKETLKSKGLTELDIREANMKVERAKRASEFTKEDLQRAKDNFIKSMKVVPQAGTVADALKAIDDYINSDSWNDSGQAAATLLESSLAGWVKNTASEYVENAGELGENDNKANEVIDILFAVEEVCEVMMEEHMRTKQKWKDIADGANAKRLLNEFYYALQERIDGYKYKSDRAGWKINFNDAAVGRNFTFFGVDSNYQTWYLDMSLEQTTTDKYGSAAGHYVGKFTMTAEHEMDNFRSRANEAIKNMGAFGDAIKKMENTPGYKVTLKTSSRGSAYISRTISGICKATIEESGNIQFTMNEQKDETHVDISGIGVDLSYSISGGTIVKGGGKVTFKISAKKEDITIGGVTNSISVIAPDGKVSHSVKSDGTMNVGWDKEIWKHWEGTKKTVQHAGQ